VWPKSRKKMPTTCGKGDAGVFKNQSELHLTMTRRPLNDAILSLKESMTLTIKVHYASRVIAFGSGGQSFETLSVSSRVDILPFCERLPDKPKEGTRKAYTSSKIPNLNDYLPHGPKRRS
jgi:hypothetical protein